MNIDMYIPYIIQLLTTVVTFAFIVGKYKTMFEQHEKILNHHEKAIDEILNRIDFINNETHYLKGFMTADKKSQHS